MTKNKKQKTTWNPKMFKDFGKDNKPKVSDTSKPTIIPAKRHVYVLSGCMVQFKHWCSRNGIEYESNKHMYVSSVNEILDKKDFDLICYGTYHDRYDWLLIINRAKDRGAVIKR